MKKSLSLRSHAKDLHSVLRSLSFAFFVSIIFTACQFNERTTILTSTRDFPSLNKIISLNITSIDETATLSQTQAQSTDPQERIKKEIASYQKVIVVIFFCFVLLFLFRDFFLFIIWAISSHNSKLQKSKMLALENLVKSHKKRVLFRARRRRMNSRWNTLKLTYWGRNVICISFSIITWIAFFIIFLNQAYPESDLTPLWKAVAIAPVLVLIGYIIQRVIKGATDVMHHANKSTFEKEALGI